ncbi:RNA polymerase II subunit A C-terminal domain phosphatase-like isoform X2 [Buteo buteo]|uniref:RNA polymerase II subunit A C-terminal domain phosphatase-like isoform X2 n=1 Tax=Buteo buteo TaxID=30397 RepID=UPI003EBB7B76
MSPSPQPRYKGAYFSGLPADECQDPAAPSLLVPAVPAPGRDGPRKTRSTPERTLVLELEGTLVCSSMLAGWRQGAVATFTTVFQGDSYKVHVKLRPHVEQFLESLSKTYEIFIFTTAKRDYAEKVLDVLDPKKKLALPLPAGLPLRPGLLLEGPDPPGQGPGQDGGPGPRHPGLPHPGCQLDPSAEVVGGPAGRRTAAPHPAAGTARPGG